VALLDGKHDRAKRFALDAADRFASIRHRYGKAHCQYIVAQAYHAVGNNRAAAAQLDQALETFRNCEDHWITAQASWRLGRIRHAMQDDHLALGLMESARTLFLATGDRISAEAARREAGRIRQVRRGRRQSLALAVTMSARWSRRLAKLGPRRLLLVGSFAGAAALSGLLAGNSPTIWLLSVAVAAAALSAVASAWPSRYKSVKDETPHASPWPPVLDDQIFDPYGAASLAAEAADPGPSGRRWRSRRRRSTPSQLPVRLESYVDRPRETEALLTFHNVLRAPPASDNDANNRDDRDKRPALILLHGKAGVGKSALAQELGRRLAPNYPDGQLYVNLGSAGGMRPPGEVLRYFLTSLGWLPNEIPSSTAARANIFRSLTARGRFLIVLDAARSPDQVLQLVPTGPKCGVIVTSRRNFGPALASDSFWLGPPSFDEAWTILERVGHRLDPGRPECVAEIVDMCGRMPIAVRAVGERVALDGLTYADACDLLGPRLTRLSWLSRGGLSIVERIETEYNRLTETERRALALLSLVPSQTFVAGVAIPLLEVSTAQAENIVEQLAATQLLDAYGRDAATSMVRYEFDPLVRLVAQAKVADFASEPGAAERRLEEQYLELVSDVIARVEGDAAATSDTGPEDRHHRHRLPQVIAAQHELWTRLEGASLARYIVSAHDASAWQTCWQIAARLGGSVPDESTPDERVEGFRLALRAAETDSQPLARIDVLLAHGAYLLAIERWHEAATPLLEAVAAAQALRERPDVAEPAAAREVAAHRKLGEVFLGLGDHDRATGEFGVALDLAARFGNVPEQRLIRILQTESRNAFSPDLGGDFTGQPSQGASFYVYLGRAEVARRRRDWTGAARQLENARRLSIADLRRAALVHLRLARLRLNQWWVEHPRTTVSVEEPVRWAARALVLHRRIHNPIGALRSRCVLGRSLVCAGMMAEAQLQIDLASVELDELSKTRPEANRVLGAQVRRVRGELLLRRGAAGLARGELTEAARMFGDIHDWASQDEVLGLLRIVDPPARPAPTHGAETIPPPTSRAATVPSQRQPMYAEPIEPFAAPDLPRQATGHRSQ